MHNALDIGQVMVVVFLAFHDWVPLGRLNNLAGVRALDTTRRLVLSTTISTMPFAAVLVASILFARAEYPKWLLWWLWGTYLACAYGILRAWWIPYLGTPDPDRAKRYSTRFAGTHAFLPERHGIKPDTLHVAFHALIAAILALLACLTFTRQ
jgi:predicted outer membrane lipoprotein